MTVIIDIGPNLVGVLTWRRSLQSGNEKTDEARTSERLARCLWWVWVGLIISGLTNALLLAATLLRLVFEWSGCE